MLQPTTSLPTTRPPFWRDVRVLAILGQVLFVLLVVLIARWLYGNVTSEMQRIGIGGGYGFMSQPRKLRDRRDADRLHAYSTATGAHFWSGWSTRSL